MIIINKYINQFGCTHAQPGKNKVISKQHKNGEGGMQCDD